MIAIRLNTLAMFDSCRVDYAPAGASAANEVENVAWLERRSTLSLRVQSIHEIFQDVERRETAHAAAIEGQQTEAFGVEGIWPSAVVSQRRLFHVSPGSRDCFRSSRQREKGEGRRPSAL